MKSKDKKQLERLRKAVQKERDRLHLNHVKFNIQANNNKGKPQAYFRYRVDIDKGLDIQKNRLFGQKMKSLPIKNTTIYDVDFVINNLKRYVDEIELNMQTAHRVISSDRDSIKHWFRVYTENDTRRGNIKLRKSTLKADRFTIRELIKYLEKFKPRMLNIKHWPSEGKNTVYEYLNYKQTIGGQKKKWNNTTVYNNYRRLRAFMNFISDNEPEFPERILSRMHFAKNSVKIFTFTDVEMEIIKSFCIDYRQDKSWSWFIPILEVLLQTGMRISEIGKLKIKNLEFENRRCLIYGKGVNGGKPRWIYFTSDSARKHICNMVLDDKGNLRTDKEYIFHFRIYKVSHGNHHLFENTDKTYSSSGISHKFKKMIRFLNLNEVYTTHDTRRYFITKMLIKTNGNIPLVAQLVGHTSWEMVRLYCKDVIQNKDDLNVNLFAA